jgi:hypothetical protein
MKEFKEYLEQTSKQSKKEYGIITTSDGYKELSKPSHRYKGEESAFAYSTFSKLFF